MKKVALITGGTRGIGLGISKALSEAGFDLAVNGVRPEEQVKQTLDELRATGTGVIYCRGDISRPDDRNSILDAIERRYGRLDVLVNNAGIAPPVRTDLLDASVESFEQVLRTNLEGPYFLTQQAARRMIEYRRREPGYRGCIVTISSISSHVASVNRGEYCVAKAGLSMMTKLFAVRLGEFSIPVYEVQPGVIATDMTAGVKEKYDRQFAGGLAVENRWGTPEDVGRAVATLAGGGIPYATGQVLVIDGGLTIERL